jgi:imidazolonepropionase-like amidohydrolase
MRRTSPLFGLALGVLFSLQGFSSAHAARPQAASFAVSNVRVFDGEAVIPLANVVVRHGVIVEVGPNVVIPSDLSVIDGTGSTLIPGMIDSHGHARERHQLETSARWGVTTFLDMWSSRQFVARMKREQAAGRADDRADLLSAINPATLPEGYPYNFTPRFVEKPTLATAAEAEDFANARFDEGSDYLKLMVEDMSITTPLTIATLDGAMIQGLTDTSHARGKLAVAHAIRQSLAELAVEHGVDGLVHVFVDEPADPTFAVSLAANGIFVVPTLSVIEWFATQDGFNALAADPDLAPFMTAGDLAALAEPSPLLLTTAHVATALSNAAALSAAGVDVLAGTDSAVHGLAIHRDLELAVDSGMAPEAVLAGVTSKAADAYRLNDRGRIAPGQRADLLLLAGDPTADIKATRRIQRIWKQGVEIERPLAGLFATPAVAADSSPFVCRYPRLDAHDPHGAAH